MPVRSGAALAISSGVPAVDIEPKHGQIPDAINSAPHHTSAAPKISTALSGAEGWKKVHELALRQLNRFMSYEAKVLKGDDADALHDMRVASRRLQQVLDLLYPKPRPAEYRKLRRGIRGCRQVLGEVRNCDVLLEHVERALGRKRSARREAWTAVQHYLLGQRSKTFLRAIRKLGKSNLAVFYVNLKDLLHHGKAPVHSPDHRHQDRAEAGPEFTQQLTQALQSIWTAFEAQVELSHRDTSPTVIHAARIATKRLRYLLEVFHEVGVEGSAEALAWLRQLQKHLGDWHDMEVLEQMMIKMLARPEFLREQLPLAIAIEKLILRNRKSKAGFEEKYFTMSRESDEIRRLQTFIAYLLESPSAAFDNG
jgi:CHAD domain-containing protein